MLAAGRLSGHTIALVGREDSDFVHCHRVSVGWVAFVSGCTYTIQRGPSLFSLSTVVRYRSVLALARPSPVAFVGQNFCLVDKSHSSFSARVWFLATAWSLLTSVLTMAQQLIDTSSPTVMAKNSCTHVFEKNGQLGHTRGMHPLQGLFTLCML